MTICPKCHKGKLLLGIMQGIDDWIDAKCLECGFRIQNPRGWDKISMKMEDMMNKK